jgi:hypothetical protein
MPSQALLCVDSADAETYERSTELRIGSNTPANININEQRPMLFGYMTRLSLTEVNFQWNIPNVNATNNTMSLAIWNTSGVLQYCCRVGISLLNGQGIFLTLPGVVAALITALNGDASANASGQIAYEGGVGGLPLVNPALASSTRTATDSGVYLGQDSPGGSTRRFSIIPCNATTVISPLGVVSPTNLPPLADDLTNMLGLTPTKQSLLPCPTVYNGSYASAQYTPYVDIESTRQTKNQNVQDGTSQKLPTASKLARIYLAPDNPISRVITISYNASGVYVGSSDNAIGCSPFVMRREFANPKIISWNTTENVDNVDLRVIDYRGNLLPVEPNVIQASGGGDVFSYIGNTADFQFTIMASEQ